MNCFSLLPALLLAFTTVGVSAEDIYVAQNPAGANSGLDCTTAHSAAWFNAFGNWGSGAGKISAGDTVHLCGTITTNLTAQASGSSGSPITILFEPGANLTQSAGGPFLTLSGLSYIIVDGGTNGIIQNTGAGTSGSHIQSRAVLAVPCNNCEFRNLTIANLYVHNGTAAEMSDITAINCIKASGDNMLIHDNVMHDAGWCIYFDGSNAGLRIYNNNIYNVDHAISYTPASQSTTAGPVYIYKNHIHDYSNWDTTTNAYHHDGIHCYTVPNGYPLSSGPPVQGAHIVGFWLYNNLFDGNVGGNATGHIFLEPGVQTDGTATPCMDGTSQVHIFGNLLLAGTTANGTIDLGRDSAHPLTVGLDFYNNTVVGSSATDGRAVVFESVNTINAENNILGGANKLWDGVSFSNTDFNGYVSCATGVSYNCWMVSGGTNNFSTWKSGCSCDAHAVNSQANTDGVNVSTGTLQAGSVMIGAGTNLLSAVSSWPIEQQNALATDRNGYFRGSGNWDIGALAFESAGVQPAPPTGLTAIVK
jgi:hypothetical protein